MRERDIYKARVVAGPCQKRDASSGVRGKKTGDGKPREFLSGGFHVFSDSRTNGVCVREHERSLRKVNKEQNSHWRNWIDRCVWEHICHLQKTLTEKMALYRGLSSQEQKKTA